jgi:hypothetical protein
VACAIGLEIQIVQARTRPSRTWLRHEPRPYASPMVIFLMIDAVSACSVGRTGQYDRLPALTVELVDRRAAVIAARSATRFQHSQPRAPPPRFRLPSSMQTLADPREMSEGVARELSSDRFRLVCFS